MNSTTQRRLRNTAKHYNKMKHGWEIKKLGEVFDLQMGKTPSRDNGDYWGGDNVWVAISDLQDKYIGESKEHITDKALIETKIKKVKAGTTIMSFKLSVGRAAITTQDLYTNEAIMAFNLNEGYDLIADYIYYYLKGYKWQGANKAVMGLTLNKASISQNHIAIPPREEQERIVAELDCLSGVIERKREQLKQFDALAQSIFYQMFGNPIANEKGWEVKKLEEVCNKITDGTHDTPERLSSGVKFITGKHIRAGIIDYDNSDYVLKEIHDEIYARCNPEYGDVLYTNIGANLGTAAINVVRYEFSMKNVALLKVKKDIINGYYLQSYLNDEEVKDDIINNFSNGGAQKFLSLKMIAKISIPLPPLVLQQEFADKIEAIEKQKELIKQSITQTEELFNSRMDYYFN